MTEFLFGMNLFDVFFEFLVSLPPPSANMEGEGLLSNTAASYPTDVIDSLWGWVSTGNI